MKRSQLAAGLPPDIEDRKATATTWFEQLRDRIDAQLAAVRDDRQLVRSFFQAPSVAYIRDC